MKHLLVSLTAGLLLMITCETVHAVDYMDGVAAVVGDEVITVYEVVRQAYPIEQSLREQLAGERLEEQIDGLRQEMAKQMVRNELLFQEYQQLDMKLPEEFVDEQLDSIVVSKAGGDYANFERMLEDRDMSMAEYREQLEKQLAAQVLIDQMVRQRVSVTPGDIESFYRNNRDEFTRPGAVHLQVIFLQKNDGDGATVEEELAEVQQQLDAGQEFEELARRFSDDVSAERGGDLGWVDTESGKREFIEQARQLEPGEVGNPIVEEAGIFVIKVVDKKPAEVTELDDELRAQIRGILREKEMQRLLEEYMDELRDKYYVKTFF